jgi:putative Mn2+ efflux pump MntP
MGVVELFLIAVGLSMDAFAAAVCAALSDEGESFKGSLTAAAYFGIFQAGMPLIGYLAGSQLADKISAYDHWVTFILLAVIGGKMIRDSFDKRGGEEEEGRAKAVTARSILPLAFATSVDALAVGVSFSFLRVNILPAAAFIGAVTFALSLLGARMGKLLGMKYRSKAELAGGIILIAIGVKILAEHLEILAR